MKNKMIPFEKKESTISSETYVSQVLADLNAIRNQPASVVNRFRNVVLFMSRLKTDPNMVKEFELFEKILRNSPGVDNLTLSPGLSKVAEDRLEKYANSEEPWIFPQDELQVRCDQYVSNYTQIFSTSDIGADDPISSINRIVMSDKDPDKINRRILMDRELKYIGIAHRIINEENAVVLIVSDTLKELPSKASPEGIINYLNDIRNNPKFHLGIFDTLRKYSEPEESSKISSIIDYLKNAESNTVLNQNFFLKDLAKLLLTNNNLKAIKTDEELKNFALNYFSGINSISFYVCYEENYEQNIIRQLLNNDNARKNFLESSINKYIAVLHHQSIETILADSSDLDSFNFNEDSFKQFPFTVLITCDEIQQKDDVPLEHRFLDVINYFRNNPSSYTQSISNYLNYLNLFQKNAKKNLIDDLSEFKKRISAMKKSLPCFNVSPELSKAAEEYFNHLAENKIKNYYSQDEEYVKIYLSHFINGHQACQQFIRSGLIRPEEILTDLIVSENDEEKKSRTTILNAEFIYLGLYSGKISDKYVTVLFMTDRADEISWDKSKFKYELIKEINNIRMHPKSYKRYFTEVLEEISNSKNFKSKNEKDLYLKNLYDLIKFVENTRSHGVLLENSDLQKACDVRYNQYLESETSVLENLVDDTEELRTFLSDYGTGYNRIDQIYVNHSVDKNLPNPREFLVYLLTLENLENNLKNRSIIFSPNFNHISITDSYNSQKDTGFHILILISDEFEKSSENLRTRVNENRRKLKRPVLTDEEILQIKKDFKQFDHMNTGYIRPKFLILFMDSTAGYSERNPFYYKALKLLDTDENNTNGVDNEEFLNTVKKVIRSYDEENQWNELFSLYLPSKNQRFLNEENLKKVSDELGYDLGDEEIREIMLKLDESGKINSGQFADIMNSVENSIEK